MAPKRKTPEVQVKVVNIVQSAQGNPHLVDSRFVQQFFIFKAKA